MIKEIIQYIFWIIVGLTICCAIFLVLSWLANFENESKKEIYNFYKEKCPELNSTIIEPVKNYAYHPKCFKVIDNEIKRYYIAEVNGEYFLSEI